MILILFLKNKNWNCPNLDLDLDLGNDWLTGSNAQSHSSVGGQSAIQSVRELSLIKILTNPSQDLEIDLILKIQNGNLDLVLEKQKLRGFKLFGTTVLRTAPIFFSGDSQA